MTAGDPKHKTIHIGMIWIILDVCMCTLYKGWFCFKKALHRLIGFYFSYMVISPCNKPFKFMTVILI